MSLTEREWKCSMVDTGDKVRKTKADKPKSNPLPGEESGILQSRQATWAGAVLYRLPYKFQMATVNELSAPVTLLQLNQMPLCQTQCTVPPAFASCSLTLWCCPREKKNCWPRAKPKCGGKAVSCQLNKANVLRSRCTVQKPVSLLMSNLLF